MRVDNYLLHHETDFRSIRRFGCVAAHAAMLNSHQSFASLIIDVSPHDLCPIYLLFKQIGYITINAQGQPWQPTDSDLFSFHPSLEENIRSHIRDLSIH
jgi:fructose-1,6-bisphosphatase/inositol monophosphatase family enzyme